MIWPPKNSRKFRKASDRNIARSRSLLRHRASETLSTRAPLLTMALLGPGRRAVDLPDRAERALQKSGPGSSGAMPGAQPAKRFRIARIAAPQLLPLENVPLVAPNGLQGALLLPLGHQR